MKNYMPEKIADEIQSCAKSFSPVVRIWLYGSRARGDFKERSDIDLAVEAPLIGDQSWVYLCERLDMIETILSFDIVRFDTTPLELKEKIHGEGILLYEQAKS